MVTRSISSTIIQDGNYRSKFTHENEVARPGPCFRGCDTHGLGSSRWGVWLVSGYYSVPLLTPNATAEVTVSGPMAGIHQYTFHDTAPNSDAFVLVDVCHTISKDACANASVTTSFDASSRVANISGRVLTHGSLTGIASQLLRTLGTRRDRTFRSSYSVAVCCLQDVANTTVACGCTFLLQSLRPRVSPFGRTRSWCLARRVPQRLAHSVPMPRSRHRQSPALATSSPLFVLVLASSVRLMHS